MYKIGTVYIWQNQVGEGEHLNGTETTVIGEYGPHYGLGTGVFLGYGQRTDTPTGDNIEDSYWFAERGDLRPRNEPPKAEQDILNLFLIAETDRAFDYAEEQEA
jgi:hypothetical protein